MGDKTKIEWTAYQRADGSWAPGYTFNPWIGCTNVSAAYDLCYAETLMDHRYGRVKWGGERKRTSSANWRKPLQWNKAAREEGVRPRVFCASLADVFDNQVPQDWRDDLWKLIDETPDLDWLLLTKRPQNVQKMLPPHGFMRWRQVALGVTAENQEEADRRIPILLSIPCLRRFVSAEPLLGPVDFTNITAATFTVNALTGDYWNLWDGGDEPAGQHSKLDWIIAGGESGKDARPSHPDWFRQARDQCAAAGVPFLFKQWGEWRHAPDRAHFKEAIREPWQRLASGKDGVRPALMVREGKKRAGRLLDGVEHNQFPEFGR